MPEEQLFLLITCAGVIVIIISVTIFLTVFLVKNRRQHLEFQRELLTIRMNVQEITARQIAMELHDGVCHELTLGRLELIKLQSMIDGPAELLASQVAESLSRLSGTIRDISKSLSGDVIALEGFEVAVQKDLERLRHSTKLQVALNVVGTYEYMPETMEHVLFGIFQEAITNIVRHADARSVTVTFECADRAFLMMIADDGKGFDTGAIRGTQARPNRVDGFATMRARATMIGADLQISSKPGVGTKVCTSVRRTQNVTSNG